ncbi:siphovirus Gp157 family protein [Bordetella genomosp. 4]|uniref:Siphovirus Gp157 family protein n=1 Tax=Bordetella genomosp. 4 TaxID=463044 RepID=A0A261U7E6_9BORD|nr:siphovirus Gp157 family protein [Bordetella genomosp. 4]OZI56773.1 hypothetical protein CAL20_15345 [Bordetella genomosp. 4]
MTAITLYQLAAEHSAALEQLADMDLPPEVVADTLESLGGELETKAQNVVAFMRNLETTAAAIKEAEKSMADRRKAIENRVEGLKRYVLESMVNNNIQVIECPLFKISIAKNPPAVEIEDERLIPADYFTSPPPPPPQLDKTLIKKAIQDGFDVPGARLRQGVRLAIR